MKIPIKNIGIGITIRATTSLPLKKQDFFFYTIAPKFKEKISL